MDEFADKAIQPCHDPWPCADSYDKPKIYADLTKAYKKVRLALNVETSVQVSLLPEPPERLAPQKYQPARKPWIYVCET